MTNKPEKPVFSSIKLATE